MVKKWISGLQYILVFLAAVIVGLAVGVKAQPPLPPAIDKERCYLNLEKENLKVYYCFSFKHDKGESNE